jgi:GTPase SAR1 family protein
MMNKVVLLGSAESGKTSLMYRALFDQVVDERELDASLEESWQHTVADGTKRVQFQDTVARSQAAMLYIMDADAFIFAYDSASSASFDVARDCVDDASLGKIGSFSLQKCDGGKTCVVVGVLVAMRRKCSDESERCVSVDEGRALAMRNRLHYCEASVDDGASCRRVLEAVAEQLDAIDARRPAQASDDGWCSLL